MLSVVERLRDLLVVIAIGLAGIVMLGGLASKSWASSAFGDGTGQGWTDGVKPWAMWAFFGGLLVMALLVAGRIWRDGLWLAAGLGACLLWYAGSEASAYRERLEGGMFTMYEQHTVSFGLRVVPTAGTVGAIVVGALAVLTLGMMVMRRARPSTSG